MALETIFNNLDLKGTFQGNVSATGYFYDANGLVSSAAVTSLSSTVDAKFIPKPASASAQQVLTYNGSTATWVASAASVGGGTLTFGASQNATGLSTVSFTGIPSSVKKITIMYVGIQTTSNGRCLIQLGTSGGYLQSGYLGSSYDITNSVGFSTDGTTGSPSIRHGIITLTKLSSTSNIWVEGSTIGLSNNNFTMVTGGSVDLGGTLTSLRLITHNTVGGSTENFAAGTINIIYEG